MNAKKMIAAALAAGLLAALPAAPAGALGLPNITASTTMGEIRANESLIASGFNTYDRNIFIPEQPWMYDSWTLEEYLGGTAPDAAQGLNLVIDNYNHGVQVTYKIYTPEEIAADPRKDEVELYYFPAKTENAKYALVVPGNMYEKSAKMREGCWQPEEDERVNLFAGIENLFGAGFSRISAILDGSASRKQYSPLKTLLFFGANITNSLRNLTANALHFGLSVFETSLAKMLYGLCYGAGVFDKAYKSDLTLVRAADEIAAEILTGIVPPFDKAKFRAAFKLPADADCTDRGFRIVYRDDAYVENAVMEHVRSAITASGVDPALFILTLPSANARTAFGQILKTQQKRSGKSRRKKESETDAPPADKHKKAANTADPAQMTIFDQLDKETENGTEA